MSHLIINLLKTGLKTIKKDKKDQGQVDDFKIDTLLESTIGQQNQTELISPSESFTGSQIKTTIEASDVPREYFPKCLDQSLHLDESKTMMAEVLEDIKPVKIDIPLLNVTKQLPAYTNYSRNFALKLKNLGHIF